MTVVQVELTSMYTRITIISKHYISNFLCGHYRVYHSIFISRNLNAYESHFYEEQRGLIEGRISCVFTREELHDRN